MSFSDVFARCGYCGDLVYRVQKDRHEKWCRTRPVEEDD